jgi:zinc transporter ZupT
MAFWQYILLFGTVLAGGLLAFRFSSIGKQVLQSVLSFVGAYLLGIIVLHLLPDVYIEVNQSIGLWVLTGFFIQILLERLSLGVEHGHIHDHHHTTKPIFALQVMIGLCIHAFIEGLPLSTYATHHAVLHAHEHNHDHFFYGVILHKAPEAFALAVLLLMSRFEKQVVWGCLIIFSAMSPLGAYLVQVLDFQEHTFQKIIAIVVGSLLHISTVILFETDNTDEHRIRWHKILAILLGVGLALLTLL